ncbi:MAG: hypothetical protein M3Z32_09995 [Acidobacteriota bacterium]|nr:hypothetical protein [Acidobacteriota bacterium]
MTVDERIEALTARHEALTARHEALTQSVELITGFHRDTETAIKEMAAGIDQIRQLVLIHEMRIKDLEN